ncbi:hypothetical protein K461DRAFT_26564 [Myriangium duriaei CBS 260.36]|uniref:Uncharacterized protein n=1 Tax=Myriangium duriaei CBS 260.36 TaxID=1168546 RepID=A0A9P4MK58_9PEZI|nr:hypothetical protein K461DRAFT_26564 [Myriangium duriaei CBS 260.36]
MRIRRPLSRTSPPCQCLGVHRSSAARDLTRGNMRTADILLTSPRSCIHVIHAPSEGPARLHLPGGGHARQWHNRGWASRTYFSGGDLGLRLRLHRAWRHGGSRLEVGIDLSKSWRSASTPPHRIPRPKAPYSLCTASILGTKADKTSIKTRTTHGERQTRSTTAHPQ